MINRPDEEDRLRAYLNEHMRRAEYAQFRREQDRPWNALDDWYRERVALGLPLNTLAPPSDAAQV